MSATTSTRASATPRIARHDLLVELGTEELPPKALPALQEAFAEGVRARLDEAGLVHSAVESFATPRRLAVRVRRLAAQQPDQQVQRRGPPVKAAFDAAGAPTRAATAFAASCGVELAVLGREQDARGNEYLCFAGVKPGAATVTLLPGIVQAALDALPTPRRMRWGAGEAQFVRPVHWLLFLYGGEVVPATILGVSAGNVTFGHRFMSIGPLRLRAASGYEKTLETRGRVVASFTARRERIRSQVSAAATALGGRAILSDELLDEVTALVEWPVAVAGQFEMRFLQLPREVLIATLQDHQRYFAVEDAAGALLARFITVSNIDSPEPLLVRGGNERVVRPRLADAAFFYDQDRKQPLSARRAGLDAVTFQAQLGSIGARSRRIEALAVSIAAIIDAAADTARVTEPEQQYLIQARGADAADTARAAQLAKCDLLTAMVGEFPELQGVMGSYYALADAETPQVAAAIREHYLPRGAGDALPVTGAGCALALADKLDLLAGIFAIGQKPSGTRDPFGLRRAAIGLLRILLEQRLELDLAALITQAVRAQPLPDIGARTPALATEIYGYVMERLRAQYLEAPTTGPAAGTAPTMVSTAAVPAMGSVSTHASPSTLPCAAPTAGAAAIIESTIPRFTTELFDAVLAARPASVLDFDARLRALQGFLGSTAGASLAAANKRIANILKKADAVDGSVEPTLLRSEAETALHVALQTLIPQVQTRLAARDYAAALTELSQLRNAVDSFFDQVLVNDPDEALRRNRLALLGALRGLFLRIADLSRLPG